MTALDFPLLAVGTALTVLLFAFGVRRAAIFAVRVLVLVFHQDTR